MTETQLPPTTQASIARPSILAIAGHGLRGLFWVMVVMALGTLIGTVAWVRAEPRNLDNYLPWITQQINQNQSYATIKIGHLDLAWHSWNKPLILHANHIELQSKALEPMASIPSASIGVDMWHLAIGSFRLRRIEAEQARFYVAPLLSLAKQRLTPHETSEPILHRDFLQRLRLVNLQQIELVFPEKDGEFSAIAEAHLAKTIGFIEASARVTMAQAHGKARNSSLTLQAKAKKNSRHYDISGSIENLWLSDFGSMSVMKDIAGLDAPIFSQFSGKITPKKTWLEGEFKLAKGTLTAPKVFASPLPIQSFNGLWTWNSDSAIATLKNAALALPDVTLHVDAASSLNPKARTLQLDATMGALNIERLSGYWPLVLAPLTRDWAMASIFGGRIEKANLKMNLTPQDFRDTYFSKEAIDATIHLADARLKYIPNHPEVNHINGAVHFTGTTMDVDITNAQTLTGAQVSKGHLHISDLNSADTRLQAKLTLSAPAPDVATFLALPDINLAKRLHIDPATAKGRAEGDVNFDALIFTSNPNPTPEFFAEQFFYDIKGKLSQVAAPKFLGNKDIEQGNLAVAFDNDYLLVEGEANINGAATKLKLIQDEKTKTSTTEATLKGDAVGLSKFGITLSPYVQGPVDMQVSSKQVGKDPEKTTITLDMKQAVIDYPYLALSKAAGEIATLSFDHVKKNELDALSNLTLQTKEGVSKGSLLYDNTNKSVQAADFSALKVGKHDCALSFSQEDGIQTLSAKGNSLDAHGFWNDKPDPKGPREEFGAMMVDMDLNKLYLHKEKPLRRVNASMLCSASSCSRAKASGFTGENNSFSIEISRKNNKRTFKAEAKNAGEFIQALDFMDTIEGGDLMIEGVYDDRLSDGALDGTLYVKDIRLNEAPLLTKILSLTSPLGFVETLMGKGVSFTRVKIPFRYQNKIITLKEGKASGPSLGFLADGTVDTHTSAVDINGSVVPAYVFNSLIEKIPLIGSVLTGGKGEGLIATRFHAHGTYPDPSVTVNPLSMLTPGFLRGIFDILDAPTSMEGANAESGSNPASSTNARSGPDAQQAESTPAQ